MSKSGPQISSAKSQKEAVSNKLRKTDESVAKPGTLLKFIGQPKPLSRFSTWISFYYVETVSTITDKDATVRVFQKAARPKPGDIFMVVTPPLVTPFNLISSRRKITTKMLWNDKLVDVEWIYGKNNFNTFFKVVYTPKTDD